MKFEKKEIAYIIFLILSGIIFCIPGFIADGIPYYGHDTIFHVSRLVGFSNVWKAPINYTLTETGTLVNIYYPWLTMYPMWLFYRLFQSYITAYNAYILFLSLITLFISYFSMKDMTRSTDASFCFALVYSFSSYRFMDIYLRTAMGEDISIAFLPLVICGLWHILFANNKKWYVLSIGLSLISYSHLLSLYLTGIMILLIILFSVYYISDKKERLFSFLKAVLLSLLLSIGALAPILKGFTDQKLYRPDGNTELFKNNMCDLIPYIRNSICNYFTPYSIGALVFIVLIINVILIIKSKNNCVPFIYLLILLSLILFIAVSSIIPWPSLAKVSFISLIQFPWRLLLYSTLFTSVAYGMLISKLSKSRVTIVFSIGTALFSVIIFTLSVYNSGEVSPFYMITDDLINSMKVDSKDYTPVELYDYREANDFDYLNLWHGEDPITPYVADDGNALYFHILNVKKGEEIEIPACYFKCIKVFLNGNTVEIRMSDRGTILLNADSDGDSDIIVTSEYGIFNYVSWIISILTALGLVLYIQKQKKNETMRNYSDRDR